MATRKKPGRPRKRVETCPVGFYGIVSAPSIPGNCVELIYAQPALLKSIVSIFKEYDSDEIIIEFGPTNVVFIGRDHSLRVSIHIVLNAADMNFYYFEPPTQGAPSESAAGCSTTGAAACAAVDAIIGTAPAPTDDDEDAQHHVSASSMCDGILRIVVKRDNLEIVTAIIEKSHYKVMLSLRHDDLSSLFINLSCCDYDNEDCFEVSVVPRANAGSLVEMPDVAAYPLEFTLDARHLRRKISELKKVSPDMIIKKVGTSDLEINFGAVARVVYTGTYKASAKIKLRSTIAEGATFVATMSIGRIRPLMAVNMPGGITIFANYTDPLVIQVGFDQRLDNHYAIVARLLINTAH